MFGSEILSATTLSVLTALLLFAVIIELRTRKIPNWLTLSGLVAGIALTVVDQLWTAHLCGMILGFVIGFVAFNYGAGGGFAKLLTSVGTIIGPLAPVATAGVYFLLLGSFYIASRFRVPPELLYEQEKQRPADARGSLVVALGVAVSVVLLLKPWAR